MPKEIQEKIKHKYLEYENIEELLHAPEGEHYEFKEAKKRIDFQETLKYCCALANCGGGKFILGITDSRPRKVVGSEAFEQPERTRKGLMERLRIRVNFHLYEHNGKRVLVFEIAGRPAGLPVQVDGKAWWREGDSLVPMPLEAMRGIFAETGHDFSSDICPGAVIQDLDKKAIEIFRSKWAEKLSIKEAKSLPDFKGTDDHFVCLTLNGLVLDKRMLLLINKIGIERLEILSTDDFLVINALFHDRKIHDNLRSHTKRLIDMGIIEHISRNKYVLARSLYAVTGKPGVHTRLVGLDRETNKELLLKHINQNGREGTPLKELQQVLPGHDRNQIQYLLRELQNENRVYVKGNTSAARWFILQ